MQKTVSLEESIYNHSLRLFKNISNIPKNPPPSFQDPSVYKVSYEEQIAERKAENTKEILQMCMIPVFRIIILGNNRADQIDFLKQYMPDCDGTPKCHYDNTINYYTKSIEISTQPVILKVCSIPYDLLSPTNEYLSVYIKTTHVAVLIADETREDLFEYLEQYLTKIKAISEMISDTIPVLVVLKKSNATSLPKKVLKSFFSPFSSVSYYEMNAFSEASVKTVYDKTVQIIAQKIQAPMDQTCTLL